jgi:GT2 family glycosyltransferase
MKQPSFSIVIPTYSRPERLADCLRALEGQSYPRDRFEVIVVDDGSAAPPASLVASFSRTLDVKLITQPHCGPATARNTGAAQAKGNFLVFTDDDCAPARDWLQALAARFEATPDHMIGGRAVNGLPHCPFASTNQLMTDAVYAYYNDNPRQAHFFTTNNCAVPAEQFRALGAFDTTFSLAASEDREFCERWLRRGYQMTYAPEALVRHTHEFTLRSFWKHHFKYGRGALHLHQTRAQRGWQPIKMDGNFYRHVFRYPFRQASGIRALQLETLVILSYVAYTAGFWLEKIFRAISGHPSRNNRYDGLERPRTLSGGS